MLRQCTRQRSPQQYSRLLSTLTPLKRPYEIFSNTPPHPAAWKRSTSLTQPPPSSSHLEWREWTTSSLSGLSLKYLERALRRAYKQKIAWPANEAHLSKLSADEYLESFLRPITSLFGLYAPHPLPSPVECIAIDYGHSIQGVTFRSNPPSLSILIPVVVAMPDAFDEQGHPTPRTFSAISKVLEHNKRVFTIIVTDFTNITVFKPPSPQYRGAFYERIKTSQPLLALRALTLAHIRGDISGLVFVNEPGDAPIDEGNLILPEGPPVDPCQSLLPDEEVFASHRRVSDFDGASLVRNRSRALQFFRWLRHVQEHYPKLVAQPHDIVVATIGDTHPPPPPPLYPLDIHELPSETLAHLEDIQRESPLAAAGIADTFAKSKSFTLQIDGVITEGSKRSISSVFRCHITSIDGAPVMESPPLCLKLFDDRFQRPECLEEDDEELGTNYAQYMKQLVDADLLVLDEASAYDKLRPVQGSIVPWFYGAHKFTLGNGMYLYGILLEYIEGHSLADTESVKGMSRERQIAAIRSCREGVRVLDVADISQRDWHSGQVLVHTNKSNNLTHAVLVDFASATQTRVIDEPNSIDNFMYALDAVRRGGFDRELVWEHFGSPDDWDPVSFTICFADGTDKSVRVRPMFPWISSPKLYPET